jgi:hypothetical protein
MLQFYNTDARTSFQVNEIVAEIPILQMQLPEEKDPACNCGRYSENFTVQQVRVVFDEIPTYICMYAHAFCIYTRFLQTHPLHK